MGYGRRPFMIHRGVVAPSAYSAAVFGCLRIFYPVKTSWKFSQELLVINDAIRWAHNESYGADKCGPHGKHHRTVTHKIVENMVKSMCTRGDPGQRHSKSELRDNKNDHEGHNNMDN